MDDRIEYFISDNDITVKRERMWNTNFDRITCILWKNREGVSIVANGIKVDDLRSSWLTAFGKCRYPYSKKDKGMNYVR